MTEDIKVSVCVITYNQEEYIAECLQSLVDQETDFPFEIIVSDDCSTDRTREIIDVYVAKYPNLIKKCYQEVNVGACENIVSTYMKASGEYIAICEGDDFWTSKLKLAKQCELLDRDPTVGLVHSGYTKCDCKGRIDEEFQYQKQVSGWIANQLLEKNRIATLTVMVRTPLLLGSLAKFDRKKYKMLDLPVWMAISLESKIEFIDEPLACYRVLKNSLSHQVDIKKHSEFVMSAFDVKFHFLKSGKYSRVSALKVLVLYVGYLIKYKILARR